MRPRPYRENLVRALAELQPAGHGRWQALSGRGMNRRSAYVKDNVVNPIELSMTTDHKERA
jgi:hypothetical protein